MPFLILTKDNQNNDDAKGWTISKASNIEAARAEAIKFILDSRFGEDRDGYDVPMYRQEFYLDQIEVVEFSSKESINVKSVVAAEIDAEMNRRNQT